MTFVSWEFVGFFILVLTGLRVMPSRESRQLLLLIASAIFYGAGTTWHLLILALPAIVDYACAVRIDESDDALVRRRWLHLSVVSNLGLLAYFKYADFFIDSIGAVIGAETIPLGVVLPVGISFFIFKTLSYTIDVYRKQIPACRSLWRYAMFVSYFPELVAGPIVRASVFLPQMDRRLQPSWDRTSVGLQLILLGLTKKLFIADRLATLVNPVFAAPGEYTQLTVISAVIAYSIQIYCDFSGYSDMAIGVSRIIGFDLPENFNMPYAARSITEFWRRWHITLSEWLRDYLYIPLGGNRNGKWRTYANLLMTMLLGGLWHGASWTFVVWGLLHGVGLAVHKLWRERAREADDIYSRIAAWALTYAFVCLTWIFFRAESFSAAGMMLRKVAGLEPGGVSWIYLPLLLILPVVIAGHFIGTWIARRESGPEAETVIRVPALVSLLYGKGAARMSTRPHPAAGLYMLLPRAGFATAFLVTVWVLGLFLFS
ncbi:MAG TPA: MBOAT family protein, partial [Gemmatimonadaceae bacterium]|nr:MBOAT family protein [Gemmatimonadaceae bacterium]